MIPDFQPTKRRRLELTEHQPCEFVTVLRDGEYVPAVVLEVLLEGYRVQLRGENQPRKATLSQVTPRALRPLSAYAQLEPGDVVHSEVFVEGERVPFGGEATVISAGRNTCTLRAEDGQV